MPGSVGTGGSQAPRATSIRSDTDPGKGLGAAVSSPGIIGTFAKGPGKMKEEERLEADGPTRCCWPAQFRTGIGGVH